MNCGSLQTCILSIKFILNYLMWDKNLLNRKSCWLLSEYTRAVTLNVIIMAIFWMILWMTWHNAESNHWLHWPYMESDDQCPNNEWQSGRQDANSSCVLWGSWDLNRWKIDLRSKYVDFWKLTRTQSWWVSDSGWTNMFPIIITWKWPLTCRQLTA